MRRITLLFAVVPLLSVAAQPIAPKALADGFVPGQWKAVEVAVDQKAVRSICLTSQAQLATDGRPADGCQMKVLTDEPGNAVVSYKCESGLSGRTEIRRDAAGIYTIHAQGLEGGLPFASHSEWRRVGACCINRM